MMKPQAIKNNHYVGKLVALAVLAMMATLLTASGNAHASTTFSVNSAADLADVNVGDGVCDADFVTINGFTQSGASPNTLSKGTNAKLMIELNGSGVTGTFNHARERASFGLERIAALLLALLPNCSSLREFVYCCVPQNEYK